MRETRQRTQDELERAFLLRALERSGWNVSRAARSTGANRSVLHAMMTRHGIQVRRGDTEDDGSP